MKVAGLNNLGFQAAVGKTANGKSTSSAKEKSSFENILGQSDAKAETKLDNKLEKKVEGKPEKKFESKTDDRENQIADDRADRKTDAKVEAKTDAKSGRTEIKTPYKPVTMREREDSSADNDNDAEADALPSAPTMPSFNSPSLAERLPNNHINSTVSPAVNALQPAAPAAEDATTTDLTRRVVWNDFLRKMGDLGISAEDVMGAFGTLSDKDLALPPEQTVDKVVMALGLDAQQAAMAKQYFNELISKTRAKSFAQELAGPDKQLSLTLMTNKELQKRTLSKSLDAMDRNFFMPKPMGKAAIAPQDFALTQKNMDNQALNVLSDEGDESLSRMSELLRAPTQNPIGQQAPVVPQPTMSAHQMNQMVAQMQEQASTPAEKKSIDQLIKNFTLQNGKNSQEMNMAAASQAAAGAQVGVDAPSAANGSPAAALGALQNILANAKREMAAGGGDSASSDEDTQDLSQLTATPQDIRLNEGGIGKNEFQTQMAKAAGAPQPVQVPDLVQQAQVMVRDGGGEMKVTLSPEGLGDVAMHVRVQDGKVSVQMVTESDEAKKLIERQIGDLKHGLTQNNLQVDTIKIDTSSNLGKQLEQQYQDAQRQQQQAAMEQFRQDTQGWRRSFFDTAAVNPYRSQGDRPRDVQAPSTSNAKARGSRRLDLVA